MVTTTETSAGNPYGKTGAPAPGVPIGANKDMFTRLLVAQIRNQDPRSPSDPAAFVNQLSQLAQTEALENMTQASAASAAMLQSLQVLAMGGQVGADVSVDTERIELGEKTITGSVRLEGASTLTHVVLTDAAGKKTRIELPPHAAGGQAFTIDPARLGLAPGKYGIAADASDGTRPAVEINGRLDSVRLSASGAILLQVAGVGDVEPGWITGFHGKPHAAAPAALTTTS